MALKANDRILITVFTGRFEIFVGRGDVFQFNTVQGAESRALKFTFKDQDGNAIDLSGSAAARCTMIKALTGARIFNQQDLTNLDASGNADYVWSSSELDEVGLFVIEIELSDDGLNYYAIDERVLVNVTRKYSS